MDQINKIEQLDQYTYMDMEVFQNPNKKPIRDGIADAKLYVNEAPIRLVWLLKNGYGNNGSGVEGGFSISKDIIPKIISRGDFGKTWGTWHSISLVTGALLSGKKIELNKIKKSKPDQADLEAMRKMGFVNLSKIPGSTTTDPKILEAEFEFFKTHVLEQLKVYNPQVVICGGTGDIINKALVQSGQKVENVGPHGHFRVGDTLFINTFHPAYLSKDKLEGKNDWVPLVVGRVLEYKEHFSWSSNLQA